MDGMIEAILMEMEMQKDFLGGEKLETVYFGGGTPSLLPSHMIAKLMEKAQRTFGFLENAEITLEANPEDIDENSLSHWCEAGVNRLSIGVQSLNDTELAIMNRNHDSEAARKSVEQALKAGIHSVNVDLIFGSPWLDNDQWRSNMEWAFHSGADHISAYALTVEPKTLLNKKIEKHQLPSTDEARQAEQYEMLDRYARENSWEFYEVSNLSKPGHRAVHNSNYWKNKPYLGLGPSAHSYSGSLRSWNVADNKKYTDSIFSGSVARTEEQLSPKDRTNEYLMTHLRMVEGINPALLQEQGLPVPKGIEDTLDGWVRSGLAMKQGANWSLNLPGRLLCDTLTAEIML